MASKDDSLFDKCFIPGLITGAIAGLVTSLVDFLLVDGLHFGQIRFMDYAGVLIYGRQFSTFWENLFAFYIWNSIAASTGVLFILWIHLVSMKNLLLKGLFFGGNLWFLLFALIILYKVPYILKVSLATGVENFFNSLLLGAVLALAFRYIEEVYQLH